MAQNMLGKKAESKFQRFAEVLPANARTAAIIKEREEIRLAKEATEKAVSSKSSSSRNSFFDSFRYAFEHHLLHTNLCIFLKPCVVERPAAKRGA